MIVLTTKQMKKVEQLMNQTGLSYLDMMQNAGLAAFRYVSEKTQIGKKRCVVLCGNGNNAGDGFVFAREYYENGGEVSVVLCCSTPQTPESLQMFQVLQAYPIEIINLAVNPDMVKERIDEAHIIIDAIYGTGFHGELSSGMGSVIDYVNDSDVTRVALDIPSGVNADTGEFGDTYFKAGVTLCFAAPKPAHVNEESKKCCGNIRICDIGITKSVIYMVHNNALMVTQDMVLSYLPVRDPKSHKGTYGKLLNVCGSIAMSGAAMMSTLSALRMGAGTTTLAAPKSVTSMCAPYMMEAMTLPLPETESGTISASATRELELILKTKTACLLGCGLANTPDVRKVVEYVITNAECPLILDADALNVIAQNVNILKSLKSTAILTPHIGEMARLTGLTIDEVQKNLFKTANTFANEYQVVVVLKEHHTVIATPDGDLYQNTTGNAGLAKGGSGDVLAGMISALVAQGITPEGAAVSGVYLHGLLSESLSEDMSQYSMLARDLIEEIPYVLKKLDR